MNAYELAEGILAIEERIFLTRQEHKLFQNSANMLRQQADRIAELEDKLSFYEIKDLDSGLKLKPLSDEEILDIFDYIIDANGYPTDVINLARAIEERHGIK